MQRSPFGTIAGAYKLVELQLENKAKNTSKDVFNRPPPIQHVNVPLLRRRPIIQNQFQSYQAQTVSILKKKSTIGHGLNRSVQTKKSVRFAPAMPTKKNSSSKEDHPQKPPEKFSPYSRTFSKPEPPRTLIPNKTNHSRTFSTSSSTRQSRVLNSLDINVVNNSQFKKRKLEKNCSMEMTLKSLKQIFM